MIQGFTVDVGQRDDRLVTAGPDDHARVWSVARETRSPDEIERIVTARSLWKLEGASLGRRSITNTARVERGKP